MSAHFDDPPAFKLVTIKVKVGKKVKKLIKQLTRTGLWGKNVEETAEILLLRQLQTLRREDVK